jgi:hypothetical protein
MMMGLKNHKDAPLFIVKNSKFDYLFTVNTRAKNDKPNYKR